MGITQNSQLESIREINYKFHEPIIIIKKKKAFFMGKIQDWLNGRARDAVV